MTGIEELYLASSTFVFKQCTYPVAIFLHLMHVLVLDCEGSVLVMTEKVFHLQLVPPHHTEVERSVGIWLLDVLEW